MNKIHEISQKSGLKRLDKCRGGGGFDFFFGSFREAGIFFLPMDMG